MENNLSVSIIIPCYNEKETIEKVFFKVKSSHILNKEIIIVDDFSNDGSVEIINKISKDNSESKLKTIFHKKNEGKGAAIKSGLKVATCDLVLIQDSDLEYDPSDYPNLLEPFIKYNADVVYGSRFVGGTGPKRLHLFWHTFANKILTLITNIFTNLNMTDMETGYKVFKKKHIDIDSLEEKSFGIEPEITIKLAKKKSSFLKYQLPTTVETTIKEKKLKQKMLL